MPYIERKTDSGQNLRHLLINRYVDPTTLGELNYMLHIEVLSYLRRMGLKYETIAGVTGVLENIKAELYRRLAEPYEDQKIADNGDVYPIELLDKAWGTSLPKGERDE